jgi:hypothetical protein
MVADGVDLLKDLGSGILVHRQKRWGHVRVVLDDQFTWHEIRRKNASDF